MKNKTYRLLGSMLLPVALAIMFALFVSPGSALAEDGRGRVPDYDGAPTEWLEEEADTPTGTEYRLFEFWGGWWADAEKDPDPGDNLLCWAATASNMMEYTGWGFVGGMEFGNTDDFFQFYRASVTDAGHFVDAGIKWWFDGELPDEENAAVEEFDHTGFYPGVNPYDYMTDIWNYENALLNIENGLRSERAVGLSIYSDDGGAHAVTCWGFNYNDAYSPGDKEYYLGVWLSDSDSHKNQWNPPDLLRYFAVTWNDGEGRWEMPNYGGGWHIHGVTTLALFPGATRPTADAGETYLGYEGTPVTFDASDSTNGGTMWYRWDFDGDGVWDTVWLTTTAAEWTWDDDYDIENVYLEVFNERLRDMSITTVTIHNVAPVVTAIGDTINENEYATVSGTITDPGINDTFTVVIDWGDGSSNTYEYPAGTTAYSETHPYLDDDPTGTPSDVYPITVTVTDKDGGEGTATTTVTVNNVAPVVEEPYISGQPNVEFILPVVHEPEFAANFTDVGTLDIHTAVWDWGDGTSSVATVIQGSGSGTVTGSHTYMLPGDYLVTVTVTDDDTGEHSNTMMVHVADVDEALEIFNQYIQDLDASAFRGQAAQRKMALSNMFSALQDMWLDEEYNGMIQDLRSNIRARADGLIDGRANDDWIRDQEAQEHICQKVDDITAYLEYLLGV